MGINQCNCNEFYNKSNKFEFSFSQETYRNYNNPFYQDIKYLDTSLSIQNKKSFFNLKNPENNFIINIEEKEKYEKLKKDIITEIKEDNKNSFKNNINLNKNEQIKKVLEHMCILGDIAKKEIIEEKYKNPDKFIETKQALELEQTDKDIFALGLISENLEKMGVETAIEKDTNNDEVDASSTCLQLIVNGMAHKKKYDFHFEMGNKRNNEILNNKEELEKFKNNLKKKLSKDYNIPEDKIIVTYPQKGSLRLQVIFQSDEFNELDTDELKQKFIFINDDEYQEFATLKEIHSDVIMGGCKLSKNQLDSRGNRIDGWGENQYRGNLEYNPPLRWTGIGLKVLDKFENNKWLDFQNLDGEWCVAYHGVGRGLSNGQVKAVVGLIVTGEFKPGRGQVHKDCEDIKHPGNKVREGVYCTPSVKTAAEYAGESEIKGKKYKTVLMVRVKPDAIRQCKCYSNYWVVNGTIDEIRPYRILYREVKNNC